MKKPIVLCILDGCGIRKSSYGNAFLNARKPMFDYLFRKYPHTTLEASGNYVGLPEGQMGNSEVGHTNIGAGRVVYQPLEIINRAILDKSFYSNKEILKVINHVKSNNSNLHIMGLISDGGVHSHINHLLALIDLCKMEGCTNVFFDLFLDGRDTDVRGSLSYIKVLIDKISEVGFGKLASISGRYYAMDRDNNYDRLKLAYDAIVNREGVVYRDVESLIGKSWDNGVTDEFVKPGLIDGGEGLTSNDGVITFNFRPDRLRELFTALTNEKEVDMETKGFDNLSVVTMFPVTESVKCPHAFNHQDLKNTLGIYLEQNDLSQLRIAETEKYAHVTYFFDGGIEQDFSHMDKILIPSPKVRTYDLKPSMSAGEITEVLLEKLDEGKYDVVILNYANGDMVGHTGVYEAAVEAVEYLDGCLKRLYEKVEEMGGILIVTADHGNCDMMWDDAHNPVTTHTTYPVPFIITKDGIKLNTGSLSDIAPTIIDLLGLVKPREMSGKSLIQK